MLLLIWVFALLNDSQNTALLLAWISALQFGNCRNLFVYFLIKTKYFGLLIWSKIFYVLTDKGKMPLLWCPDLDDYKNLFDSVNII